MDLGGAFMGPLLQNQQYLQNQQMMPAELAQKAASARYTTAQAQRAEMELEADKKVAAGLAQSVAGGSAPDGTLSGQLRSLGEMYVKAGLVSKGSQLLQQASQAQAHEATSRAAQVRQALGQMTLQAKQLDIASRLLGGVKDQASWDAANTAFEQETGQQSPFKGMEYNPELVKSLRDASMTAYQRQLLGMRQTALEADLANKKSAISSRETRDAVAVERLRISQSREQRLAKSGGKDIGSPSKGELDAADRLLPKGMAGDNRDEAAFAIASEAKKLRRMNPGLDADEALRQALLSAQKSGEFFTEEGAGVHLPFIGKVGGKDTTKFTKPLPLPSKKADLVEGKVYLDPKGGGAYRWSKDGWVKVGGGKTPPAAAVEEEDDDTGEEDAAE